MAKFIPCDGAHDDLVGWEWQVVNPGADVNLMLCTPHFFEWVVSLLAPAGETPAEPATVPAPDPVPDDETDAEAGVDAQADEVAHRARTRRKLAARPSGAATSLAVAPEVGHNND